MIEHLGHNLNSFNELLFKCNNCNIRIIMLHGKFKYWNDLKELELTCEEEQIKKLLE